MSGLKHLYTDRLGSYIDPNKYNNHPILIDV